MRGTIRGRAPAWLIKAGPWVFVVAVALHVVTAVLWPRANWTGIDMTVYRAGGMQVLLGQPLYQAPVLDTLQFTYPPFAAVLFTPLALLNANVARVFLLMAELALLLLISRMCWRGLTKVRDTDLTRLSLGTAGLALWIDPIRITVYLGQINTLLMALVVWDLFRSRSRWAGVGVGIAAGVKLTPLIFIPFLLLTRRFREAAVATGAFVATILISFVVVPSDATAYWLHGTFLHSDRVADPAGPGNQSLNGALLRLLGHSSTETVLWLALGAVVAVGGMALAVLLHRRGHALPAIALVGMLGCMLSPYSWNHHWVWVLLPLIWLLAEGRTALAAVGYFVCLGLPNVYPPPGPPTGTNLLSGWMYLPVDGWPQQVLRNLWPLIYVAAALACGWLLARRSVVPVGSGQSDV